MPTSPPASAAGLWAFRDARAAFPRRLHPGTIPGGIAFGVGWALTGACPSIALVQLGEGSLPASFTLGGILLGTWLFGWLNPRLFRFDAGSCDS